jgi:Tat protein translocase TatB subunit
MFNIGTPELFLILIFALVVVGPRRLPEIGRTVGRVMAELRKAQDEVRDMVKFDLRDDPKPTAEGAEVVPTPVDVRTLNGPGGNRGDDPTMPLEPPDGSDSTQGSTAGDALGSGPDHQAPAE